MPSNPLRRASVVLGLLVASMTASVERARADDPAPAPAVDPLTAEIGTICRAASFDMALEPSGLPAGWKILEGAAAGGDAKALSDAIVALATEKGVASVEPFHVETRTVAADGGAKVVFALVDLGAASAPFSDALNSMAAAKGAASREMGLPTRLLVVAAPEALRAKAVAVQTAWAVKILTVRATSTFAARRPIPTAGLARFILGIDPKAAGAHLILGLLRKQTALAATPLGDLDPAIADLRAATAKDATSPLSASDLAIARGNLGSALLNKGGPSEEARDALKLAVASLQGVPRADGLGFRYDLACAHSRLKELDPAFGHLTAVLEENAKEPVPGISAWRQDVDFDPMKEDARWAKLLETYGAESE